MYTSVVLLALSAGLAPTAELIPVAPTWRNDYGLALKEGKENKRPLVIVAAAGPEGWDKVSREGGLDKEAKYLLHSRYVCVYLDTSKEYGRRLAEQLDLGSGRGIVIGDSGGTKQAFWHPGTLPNEDLGRYLRKYADPDRVIVRTETVAEAAPAPVAPVYSPSPQYYNAPPANYFRSCST